MSRRNKRRKSSRAFLCFFLFLFSFDENADRLWARASKKYDTRTRFSQSLSRVDVGFFFFLALQSEKPRQDSFGLGGLYFFLYLSGESFLPFFPQHLPDTHNGESLKSLLSIHSCSPYPCLNKTQPGLNSGGHRALTAPPPPRPHRDLYPGRGWEEGSLVPPLRLFP